MFLAEGAAIGPVQLAALAATGQVMFQGTSETSAVSGIAKLQDTEAGLQITLDLEAPPGEHGFHIHEFGSCADAGNAAGGHYNPDRVKHGYLLSDGFSNAHAGDLGNVRVNSDGKATYTATVSGLSLTQGKYSVAGRAMIVHEKPDDFGQPTGNAGGRPGCGTIILTSAN
ncbi:superoxide dismutase family protein [Thermocoleostomius sinensis]|uniref:Superoxide dismutase [Cu-Zn] n=1 Tax=Thermocoleostomius sinensis A174 TaxID=2016057 RepID=A0A9E8ZB91_9CYAN|nr:superoxide dismutase family protein [Thermocoleostomius sinensis]WAL58784.1 superoxide dismutase family protein [Thermocoleostomius sinensis A174]